MWSRGFQAEPRAEARAGSTLEGAAVGVWAVGRYARRFSRSAIDNTALLLPMCDRAVIRYPTSLPLQVKCRHDADDALPNGHGPRSGCSNGTPKKKTIAVRLVTLRHNLTKFDLDRCFY